jgi:hypothetical protein
MRQQLYQCQRRGRIGNNVPVQQQQLPRNSQMSSIVLLFTSILVATSICVTANNIAMEETMTIEGHLQYPNRAPYNFSAEVVVNHGEYITYSRPSDGNFTIHDITPGVYIIDIISPIHHFSQVKCLYKPSSTTFNTSTSSTTEDATTATTKKPAFSCIEYHYPGATKRTIDPSNLLVLTVLASYEYFETKQGFSLLSILKNPMVLMMLFTGGIMYMLPKMMEGMDPEERAMMQKQMQMQQNPTQMMSNLFSGGLSPSPPSSSSSSDYGTTAVRPISTNTASSSPEGKSSTNQRQSKRNHRK